MTLGYDIAQALPSLRAEANSRMTETVQVGRFTDSTDPTTGNPVRTLTTERYNNIGRVRYGSGDVRESAGSGGPVSEQSPYLSIPHGSARCFEGDEVEVTASTADDLLVGRRYKITGNAVAGQTTAHRYPLEDLS